MSFKKGDRVRILRKAETRERGWGNSWSSDEMDAAIGKIGRVVLVDTDRHDVELRVPGIDDVWGYPDFVLRKIAKRKIRPAPKKRK